MAKDGRANRSRQKGECEGSQGLQFGRGRVRSRKEQLRKYQYRRRRIDIEIEEFDGSAGQARDENPPAELPVGTSTGALSDPAASGRVNET